MQESELTTIFKAPILRSFKFEDRNIYVFENDLVFIHVKPYQIITPEVFYESKALFEEHFPGKKFHLVFRHEQFSEVDPKVRELQASEEANFSLSDAPISINFSAKILAEFYLKFNKPIRPTKFFTSLEKAVDWSLKMRETLNYKKAV